MMSTLTAHCQWKDEMTKKTSHLCSHAKAKKLKSLALHKLGCCRSSCKGLLFFFFISLFYMFFLLCNFAVLFLIHLFCVIFSFPLCLCFCLQIKTSNSILCGLALSIFEVDTCSYCKQHPWPSKPFISLSLGLIYSQGTQLGCPDECSVIGLLASCLPFGLKVFQDPE